MKKLFILILLACPVFGQNHYVGISLEPMVFFSSNDPGGDNIKRGESEEVKATIQSVFLTYKYNLTNKFGVKAKCGYMDVEENVYGGYEAGGFLQYNLSNILLEMGLNFHFNEEESKRDVFNNRGTISKVLPVTLSFLDFGVGTRFSDDSIFRLMFMVEIPLKKKYREVHFIEDSEVVLIHEYRVDLIFKLSLGLEFDFTL